MYILNRNHDSKRDPTAGWEISGNFQNMFLTKISRRLFLTLWKKFHGRWLETCCSRKFGLHESNCIDKKCDKQYLLLRSLTYSSAKILRRISKERVESIKYKKAIPINHTTILLKKDSKRCQKLWLQSEDWWPKQKLWILNQHFH